MTLVSLATCVVWAYGRNVRLQSSSPELHQESGLEVVPFFVAFPTRSLLALNARICVLMFVRIRTLRNDV